VAGIAFGFARSYRDPLYTEALRGILGDAGVEVKRIPPKSPNVRPHAERFVRSIKEECLSRMMLLGERHLHRAVRDYGRHYHAERNHQGLGNELVIRSETGTTATDPVACHEGHSTRAVEMSIFVVRASLRLREWVTGQAKVVTRLSELERRVSGHDQELKAIIQAIRQLVEAPQG